MLIPVQVSLHQNMDSGLFVLCFIVATSMSMGSAVEVSPHHSGCAMYTNTSCEQCLKNVSCFWCFVDNSCKDYPTSRILPTHSCQLSKVRWGMCWVNFEALIIAMATLAGLILLSVTLCCYCCCRRNCCSNANEDERWEQERRARLERQESRKAERRVRSDQIRRKYGLLNGDATYSQLI
uniref:Pituitary tumor-transforming gene 1 protein-interacting protein-like n=1 Tax=Eptatretus burgeri TaxID=7764 RepID=A0A8C4NJH0_EPTBU